jgi:2-methylcitrate dehydratase
MVLRCAENIEPYAMDTILQKLVSYTRSFSEAEMSPSATEATLSHLVDSMVVAIAGSGSEPGRILARIAKGATSDQGATVFGYGYKTTPELAALANSMMIRTYDWNDGMLAPWGGHPSDMIPGILAAGELAHASGREILTATALAYELLGGIGWEIKITRNKSGFDQGTFMGVATALAVGKLWRLADEQLADAASLALVPNLPIAVSRWGELSMLKGCGNAFAVRNGIFSAMLAREGFTSAPEPFEGTYGLCYLLGEFSPRLPVLKDGPRVIEVSHQKMVPADTHSLAVYDLVPRIRAFAPLDEIEAIEIEAPEDTVRHVGDESKYDPRTRETADHSMPYMLAVALTDGKITLDSYRPERFLDPALRPLMRKIKLTVDPELDKIHLTQFFGATRPTPRRVTVRTKSGRVFREEVMYHRGTHNNPMTRDDVDAKLDDICKGVVSDARREKIRDAWWNVGNASDIAIPIATMTGFRKPD